MTTEHHRNLVEHAIAEIQTAPAGRWKHHGFGLLQIALTPAHRLNLWAPELRTTVDLDHGSWHTHRARIHATVLAGSVRNTEINPAPAAVARLVDVWEVPNGARHPACASLSGPFRRVATGQLIGYRTTEHVAGSSYVVEQGDGHCTESGPLGAVTSALVMDMVDEPATVFVAPGMRPALAFDVRCSDALIDEIRLRAISLLRGVL